MKSTKTCFLAILACVMWVESVRSVAAADLPLLDFASGSGGSEFQPNTGSGFTAGFSFTLSQSSTVNSLMIWDKNDDGLLTSHQVGLWNSDGSQLLASATVAAGTSDPSIASASGLGSWRYKSITPFVLNAGTYVVGGLYTNVSDFVRLNMSNRVMAPGAAYVDGRIGLSASLTFPNQSASIDFSLNNGVFGANVGLQPVPEPGSLILAALAAGTLAAGNRLRKRRQPAGEV